MKTPIELITKTRDFYSADPSRRAMNNDHDCLYFDPVTRNRCAVGRCMNPGVWTSRIADFDSLLRDFPFETLIHHEYHNIPVSLFIQLQHWHDKADNFTATGLTELGEATINKLLSEYHTP